MLVYADEFGNLGAIPEMTTWISTLLSAGVYHLLAAQIKALYGPEGFETIATSCHTKVGLSNMVKEDCEWFSAMSGQKTEVAQSSNVQRGRFHVTTDRGGASQSETKRALLTPDEVMNIREDELLVKMPQKPAARLTQRRYYDDPEVRGRAPARGESWIPPLGPARVDGPLEPPEFDDALDDEEATEPEDDESGRAPSGGQGDDEATAGESAGVTEEPDAEAADALFSVAIPDH